MPKENNKKNYQEKEAGVTMGKLLYEKVYLPLILKIIQLSAEVNGEDKEANIKPLYTAIRELWEAPGIMANISEKINQNMEKDFEEAKKELFEWQNYIITSEGMKDVPFPTELVKKINKIKRDLNIVMQDMGLSINVKRKMSERQKARRMIAKKE